MLGEFGATRTPDELFQRVVEAALTGMIVIDPVGRMVFVNARVEKLFGYRREELLGKSVELLLPQFLPGAGSELSGLCKDRTEIPVEIGLTPLPTGTGAFVLATIIEIGERQRTEAEARRAYHELELRYQKRTAEFHASEERMRLALSSAAVGTWDWDLRDNTTTWDEYMAPLFGNPPETS